MALYAFDGTGQKDDHPELENDGDSNVARFFMAYRPSDANLPWICELADGWLPIDDDPAVYGPLIGKLKMALADAGRDPARFRFRARFPYVTGADGQADLAATFARVPELVGAGLTDIEVYPLLYLRTRAVTELEDVIARCGDLIRETR